jgi:hypothetical protein
MAFDDSGYGDYNYEDYYTPPADYGTYSDPYASDAYYQPEDVQPQPIQWPQPSDAEMYYQAPPSPDQGGGYVPDWVRTAGKGLASYAVNNPKDVLGMGVGAGMGLYGLLTAPDKQKAPDLSTQRAANAATGAQLATTQGLNADAIAKLRNQLGGNYGDYADAATARQTATAQLQQLMASGPDYTLQPEEQRQLALLDQKWGAKGMLGSSLHNQEAQQLKAQFTNNALARYQSQLKALQDVTNTFSGQTSREFQNTGNVVNQGQNTALTGLSNLAASGIQGAKLESDIAANNNKLQNERSNQLLTVGGNIFGRSFSNPADDMKKIKSLG